ncbi:MAG: M23 family metallopeptidase [Gemmatimonadetes bacterium]|nr:M23 family metallopeptidase [Gemmatimonadota bacterium]
MKRSSTRMLAATTVLGMLGCGLPRWPVEGPIIAPFGVRWEADGPTIHRGVDIVVPTGTPVYAMSSGKVSFAGTMTDFGLVVLVDHRDGISTLYAHLSQILVVEGQAVTRDESLGLSGASGNATGPHLHFEVRGRGHQLDPVAMLGGPPGR